MHDLHSDMTIYLHTPLSVCIVCKKRNDWCTTQEYIFTHWQVDNDVQCVVLCCSVLQSVAECCRVLQSVAVCCSVLQCVAVCCSVLQCVAVCCSVLPYEPTNSMGPRTCKRGPTYRTLLQKMWKGPTSPRTPTVVDHVCDVTAAFHSHTCECDVTRSDMNIYVHIQIDNTGRSPANCRCCRGRGGGPATASWHTYMLHSYVWHDALSYGSESCRTHVWASHVTLLCVARSIHIVS